MWQMQVNDFYFTQKYIYCYFAAPGGLNSISRRNMNLLFCQYPGGLLGGFARQLALRDGRISCAEVFAIQIFTFSQLGFYL